MIGGCREKRGASAAASDQTMSAASPITIASDRLTVEIAHPGTVYDRSRFDWSGLITQITLDGTHTFCVPESRDPQRGTGGIGLCNEFNTHSPIGFDGIAPGERFPKLGIGLLTRPDEIPYRFARRYEIDPFPSTIDATADAARYEVHPLPCRGYAARLIKTITVRGAGLTIDYALSNEGRKPLAINEYNHNFVAVDHHGPSADYRLRVGAASLDPTAELMALTGPGEYTWPIAPARPYFMRFGESPAEVAPRWELQHLPTGCWMAEFGDFVSPRLKLWGDPGVISPEVFIHLDIQPGETGRWQRRYAFDRKHAR
jgi:hypothetical protein